MSKKNTMKDEYKLFIVRPNSLRSEHSVQLAITEQRILFYSIFKIQENKNSVSFTRQEISSIFNVDFGSFRDIQRYLTKLRTFGMDIIDEKNQKMRFINAFSSLEYNNGLFTFEFNRSYLPTLENQKERFLRFGFVNIEKFKSKYTIYLYDYLKDIMWGDINKKENIPAAAFRAIFKLNDTYLKNRYNFKQRCWGPALEEINKYTGYKIDITCKGKGQNCTYSIYRYENEDFKKLFNAKRAEYKCHLGKILIDDTCQKCSKINICKNSIDTFPLEVKYSIYHGQDGFIQYVKEVLYANKQYDVRERVMNGVASPVELEFYNWWKMQAMNLERESARVTGNVFHEKDFNEKAAFDKLRNELYMGKYDIEQTELEFD